MKQASPFIKFFTKLVETELKYYIAFALESSPNVWWHDGQKIVFRSNSSAEILTTISDNPYITIENIAARVGIVPRAVKNQLAHMTNKGYIQRREADKGWYVFASKSV